MASRAFRDRSPGSLGEALQAATAGRWAHVRVEARERLSPERLARASGLSAEEHRARVAEQMQLLVEFGHPQKGFARSHGGSGDLGGSTTAFEMLAGADLSLMVKAGVQWGLFGSAIENLGTERHHELLPDVMTLRLPGCFAMTETGHGSDVQSLLTTATYDPDSQEFVVHTPGRAARKDYIGGAARDARLAVVFAQLVTGGRGHGVHALLVPIRDETGAACAGVTVEDCGGKAGLNGVDNGRLSFDRVRVPRENLLDRYACVAADGTYTSPIANPSRRFFTMLGTLVRGRVSVAGAAGAAGRVALAIALRYADRRRQFKSPAGEEVVLLDYRSHQRRLLPLLARSYALAFAQNELVSRMHDVLSVVQQGGDADEHDQRELEARAAGIKALTTWHATRTIQECREACGGAGYLEENLLPQLRADTDAFTTLEGDNTVLLQLVAKELLVGYASEFSGLDTWGMVRFATRQVAGTVVERTAARDLIQRLVDTARRERVVDLRSRGTQLQLLEDREEHVLETLARRLRRTRSDDAASFAVYNAAQPHVLHLARVHVERVLLEAFVAGIDACDDDRAKALLGSVCDLFVLDCVEADKAWFLEHGRLTPPRGKAVTATIDALCAELRPHASALVDGLGIPDVWLGAAMLES
jgi:acyl-CoA oxidase